jgi:hypothetical protein
LYLSPSLLHTLFSSLFSLLSPPPAFSTFSLQAGVGGRKKEKEEVKKLRRRYTAGLYGFSLLSPPPANLAETESGLLAELRFDDIPVDAISFFDFLSPGGCGREKEGKGRG